MKHISRTIILFLIILSACIPGRRGTPQLISFDERYRFDITSPYPAGEKFPFKAGESVRVPVAIHTHPLRDWVFEELSAEALWYGSLRPNGAPDPGDPFGETILIEVASVQDPEKRAKLPWRVDNDDVLIAVLDSGPVPAAFARAEIGASVPAELAMEITALEPMETNFQSGTQEWRMVLIPAGDKHGSLIRSEVEILKTK